MAKEKLAKCVKLKSKSSIEGRARELLDNIWNNKIRPSWWNWWLSSPLYCWIKRIIFFILLFLLFLLLFLHPFIPQWFLIDVNWLIYAISLVILVFLLLSPTIQSIKAKEFEVKLRSPPSLEPALPPLRIEERIKELEKYYKQ